MPITATLLTSGTGGPTTASITPAANQLVLVSILHRDNGGVLTNTLSGCGISWTNISITPGTGYPVFQYLWKGISSSPSTGSLTFGYADLISGYTVVQFSNCDDVVQTVGNYNLGTVYTGSVTLAAFSSANNATAGTVHLGVNFPPGSVTPGSGFTEVVEVGSQPTSYVTQSEFRNDNDTGVDWSFSPDGKYLASACELHFVAAGSPRFKRNGGTLYMPSYMQNNGYNYSTSKRGW